MDCIVKAVVKFTCIAVYLHNDYVIFANVFDWLTIAGEHCLKFSMVRFKHTQL